MCRAHLSGWFYFECVGGTQFAPANPGFQVGGSRFLILAHRNGVIEQVDIFIGILPHDCHIHRHNHIALTLYGDGIHIFFLLHFQRIIGGLAGFKPLVEKPVKVCFGAHGNAVAEIFYIRMADFPLFHIILHGFQKHLIAQYILQVIQHGSSFVIHMAVATTVADGVFKIIAVGV